MTIIASGFCNYEGFSPNYLDFKPRHFNFSSLEEVTYNPQLRDDFEWHILHQYVDNNRSRELLPSALASEVSNILQWFITECEPGGKITLDVSEVELLLNIEFPNSVITVGPLSTDSSKKILPTHIEINERASGNSVTIWMLSTEFDNKYPYGDAVVFDMVNSVDDMLSETEAGMELLIRGLETLPFQTAFETQTMTRNATAVKVLDTSWVNINNPTETVRIPFGIALYGNVHNTPVGLTTVVREHIVNRTAVAIAIWETALPELFNVLTFTLVPSWDTIASGGNITPRYSPIVNAASVLNVIKNKVSGINGAFADEHLESLPTVYQSLMTYACPAPSNAEDRRSISSIYPDYILAGPGTPDFIHMRGATKDFVQRLIDALAVAERYPEIEVPPGFNIELIEDVTYVTFLNGTGRFRVMTKASYVTN